MARTVRVRCSLAVGVAAIAVAGRCVGGGFDLRSANVAMPSPSFESHIRPLMEAKCVRCHGATKKGGGLDCRTREALLKGGVTGPAFVPGKSGKSLMFDLVRFNEMPPKKEQPRVTPEEQTLLKSWIDAGAP